MTRSPDSETSGFGPRVLFRGEGTVIRDGVAREPSAGKDRNIVCVGRDRELLSLRAMVLRGAGFRVIEESDTTRALQLALEDSIDLVLLCHTLSSLEKSRIIYALSSTRQNTHIAAVTTLDHQSAPDGAVPVPSDPPRLIEAIEVLFQAAKV